MCLFPHHLDVICRDMLTYRRKLARVEGGDPVAPADWSRGRARRGIFPPQSMRSPRIKSTEDLIIIKARGIHVPHMIRGNQDITQRRPYHYQEMIMSMADATE